MNDLFCSYPGDRDGMLMAYLYDEIDPVERAAFETHLFACAACQRELTGLGAVRAQLAQWSPPSFQSADRSLQTAVNGPRSAESSLQTAESRQPTADGGLLTTAPSVSRRAWWDEMPAWAQVAAAILCLGVGAGAANLTIRYDEHGLSVRTGWMSAEPARPGPSSASEQAAPWRADLMKLEQQLRADLANPSAPSTRPVTVADVSRTAGEAQLVRRVKALVDESAKKQQNELAIRVAQVSRDVQAQRIADLNNIDYRLGLIQNKTGIQVAQQNAVINSLAVRVSSVGQVR